MRRVGGLIGIWWTQVENNVCGDKNEPSGDEPKLYNKFSATSEGILVSELVFSVFWSMRISRNFVTFQAKGTLITVDFPKYLSTYSLITHWKKESEVFQPFLQIFMTSGNPNPTAAVVNRQLSFLLCSICSHVDISTFYIVVYTISLRGKVKIS